MVRSLAVRIVVGVALTGILLISACAPMFNYMEQNDPRYSGSFAVIQPDTPDSITVATYNIKLGEEVERALAELISHADLSRADILLLQEMDEVGTERIARTLAYNYVYYPASIHTATNRNFGNAVLSRYPIVEDEKVLLPHGNLTRGQRRIAVRTVIDVGGTCVQVFSVHTENLSLSMSKRKDQVEALLESVSESPYQTVVGGDFNTIEAPTLTFTVAMFKENEFSWSSENAGRTANLALIDVQSDHIFARGFESLGSGHLESANASDHKPVWVNLSLAVNSNLTTTEPGCLLSDHSEE